MSAAGRGAVPMTEHQRDAKCLCRAIMELLQVNRARVISHPIFLALTQNDFSGFNEDFIHLTVDVIDQLTYRPEIRPAVSRAADPHGRGVRAVYAANEVELPMKMKLQLRMLLAFYHSASRVNKGGINILNAKLEDYKKFRMTIYDPMKEIVP